MYAIDFRDIEKVCRNCKWYDNNKIESCTRPGGYEVQGNKCISFEYRNRIRIKRKEKDDGKDRGTDRI